MPQLANNQKCTGCAACMNICKHAAITMTPDSEFFFMPNIDITRCVECGLCETICPAISPVKTSNSACPDAYAIWSIPDRQISSSGGAFSAFSRVVFARGGVVFGSVLDSTFECHHIEAHNVDELTPIRGSKYVQSEICDTYTKVKEYLLKDIWVLYTGTPCQIAGLYSFLRKDYEKLITLDLICHGVPSNEIFKSYIEKLKNNRPDLSELSGFEFRNRSGWGLSPSATVCGRNIPLYDVDNLYMYAFDKSAIFRKCCYDCKYARMPRIGDCTIGDFWGLGRYGIPFKHDMMHGVSLVIVNNSKGQMLLDDLNDVYVEKRDIKEATIENHNLKSPSTMHQQRDEIISAFLNVGISLKTINSEFDLVDNSLKEYLKKYASKLGLFNAMKRVYNLFKS